MKAIKREELRELQVAINTHKKMLECYEIRLHLIDSNKANKSEFELNEDEILKIKTLSLFDSLKLKIRQLETHFKLMLPR